MRLVPPRSSQTYPMLRPASTVRKSMSTRAPTITASTRRSTTFSSASAGAAIELDGERVPVAAGLAVMIPPGVRHRAVGRMTILNVVVPPFDPADEWFD